MLGCAKYVWMVGGGEKRGPGGGGGGGGASKKRKYHVRPGALPPTAYPDRVRFDDRRTAAAAEPLESPVGGLRHGVGTFTHPSGVRGDAPPVQRAAAPKWIIRASASDGYTGMRLQPPCVSVHASPASAPMHGWTGPHEVSEQMIACRASFRSGRRTSVSTKRSTGVPPNRGIQWTDDCD